MKKLVVALIGTLSMLILFSGCSRPEEADKAARTIVDCYIYQEDTPELESIYGLDDRLVQKENENVFLTTMQNALPEVSEEKIASLHQKLSTHLKKATSYSVHVKRDTGKEAVALIQIKGLDLDSQLDQKADQSAAKAVEAESTDEEMKKIVDVASFEFLERMYLESKAKATAETVTLRLKQHPEDEEKWEIQDEETFFKNLYQAFGL